MRPQSNMSLLASGELANGIGIGIGNGIGTPSVTERLSELRAAVGLVKDKPELVSRYHTSPLKIAKTFSLQNGDWRQLAIVQMDGSPGLLEGDRYSFDWQLQEGVRLYATNQAYTRVHPCETGGDSRLYQRFNLQSGAVMEWIPEPITLFRDARFITETEIDLAEGSVCMLGEIFCPGRLSRGEVFAFDRYDAKVSVRYKEELIHYQRQKWEPAILPIGNVGCFGNFTHMGMFSVFSDLVSAEVVHQVRENMEKAEGIPQGISWGIARTARYGLVVQVAGNAAWRLQRLLLVAWDSVRSVLLGQPPLRLLKEAWMTGTSFG
ncbi:urease accessory protein UreD [Cohnella luojiensis]|uniref:Urease accessory protein UreD n=1 Tax=Cohnella luojiensis TaxID=652876 RepID=A0A4Y8M8Z9_9BACL|nr:urease accessory protein UreD [Cohnella luojiensis]TFE31615.1 urease accessory protein UreD [Cohnella luojiensis]